MWKQEVRLCSQAWKDLTPSEREKYLAEAALEGAKREEVAAVRFPSKNEIATNNVPSTCLGATALKKTSRSRLKAAQDHFNACPEWKVWNGGISDSNGCLHLDFVDIHTSDATIQQAWTKAVNEPSKRVLWNDEKVQGCHHDTCHALYGACSSAPYVKLAGQFVKSFHHLLSASCLSSCY